MQRFDLLQASSKVIRNLAERRQNKEANRRLALQFGQEYFDGPREQGYGGYRYDGRWRAVAQRAIEYFGLRPNDRILDIGCAKGFFVKDLIDTLPGIQAYGLDISEYALTHSHPDTKGRLYRGSCDALPHPDGFFAAAFAINTIHNLDHAGCLRALREIERVAPGRGFVQVDAYRNDEELQIFEDWVLTARTYCKPEEWLTLFEEAGYTGAYYWTILEVDSNLIREIGSSALTR